MILYDFFCNYCGTGYEAFAKMKQMQTTCPNCGKTGGRCLTAPKIKLDGCDPAFSTAYQKWGKIHEQAAKIAHKREDYGGNHNGDN